MEFTQQKISEYKSQYKDLYLIKVEDYSCLLKKPSRKILSYASSIGTKDPIKFNELLLNNCWVDGDEVIKTDDELFLAVSTKLGELINIKTAELEKL